MSKFEHPWFLFGASSFGLAASVYGGLAVNTDLLGYAFIFAFLTGWAIALLRRAQ